MSSFPLLTVVLTAGVVAYHAHSLTAAPGKKELLRSAGFQAIADAGYVLRFEAGQLTAGLFRGRGADRHWLFLRDELRGQFPEWKEQIARHLAPQIASVVRHYEAQGVRTLIVPVPTKVSVERDRIATRLPTQSPWWSYPWEGAPEDARGNYEAVLAAAGDRAVDLLSLYTDYRARHPRDLLYAPQDTHWTSLGMALAARAGVEALRGSSPPALVASPPDTVGGLEYDLWDQLQLPGAFMNWRYAWREPLYRMGEAAGPADGRLILAGTSYSARLAWSPFGFGAQMAGALRRELVDEAFPRAGPNGSFTRLAARQFSFRRGDILVWELPVRYLFEPGQDVLLLPVQQD